MALTRREFGRLLGAVTVADLVRGVPRAGGAPAAASAPADPARVWAELVQGNRRFVRRTPQAWPSVTAWRPPARGRHPRAVVLGCADSGVSPELVFDQDLADIVSVRTAGNVADPVALGSIERAVEHRSPPVLIVLGHERCGAVAAAVAADPTAPPAVAAVVARIAPAIEPLRGGVPDEELLGVGVQANVHLSAKDLVDSSGIVRARVAEGALVVVKALYRPASGYVERLR
jgi:carbonic anhydrase